MQGLPFPLTAKQQEFFRTRKRLIVATESEMRGALQLILDELGINEPVTLSEDMSEVVEFKKPVP